MFAQAGGEYSLVTSGPWSSHVAVGSTHSYDPSNPPPCVSQPCIMMGCRCRYYVAAHSCGDCGASGLGSNSAIFSVDVNSFRHCRDHVGSDGAPAQHTVA